MENIFRVVVAPRIHQSGLDLLEARSDIRYEVVDDISEGSLRTAFADADGVVTADRASATFAKDVVTAIGWHRHWNRPAMG